MSTCEVLPTAKMTDDHFMNPCILIRTDAEPPGRAKDEARRRTGKNNAKPCVLCPSIRSAAARLPVWPTLDPLPFCLYLALSPPTLIHSLQLLSLDNDGSAFCKCKIYFAMYKLNVRHINNFVLRWACTNASTMHCPALTHTYTSPSTPSHTHSLATRNSHKVAPFFSFMHYVLILQKFI